MILRIAEVLIALLFVLGGLATLRDQQSRTEPLVRLGLPFPKVLVRLNGAVMVVAGLALAANIRPVLASAALVAVLVPTTLAGHAFWLVDGAARQQQMAHFMKNMAVVGGLLALTVAVQ